MGGDLKRTTMFKNQATAKVILVTSIIVFVFFLFTDVFRFDVYRYPVVGAIFELLWFPIMALLLLIPIMCVIIFIKNHGVPRIYAVLSVLFIIGSIIIMFT